MASLRFRIPEAAAGTVVVLAGLAIAACSDAPTASNASAARAAQSQATAELAASSSPATTTVASPFLACPSTHSYSASKVIGPRGGILAVDGSAIAIPPGAVPIATRFTLTIPASDIMQIEAHAEGVDHYVFERPVLVTIDYSRCGSSVDQLPSLSAWYIDNATRSPLAWMGGVDDRRIHRLFFSTGHLSGYAVSERAGTPDDVSMY